MWGWTCNTHSGIVCVCVCVEVIDIGGIAGQRWGSVDVSCVCVCVLGEGRLALGVSLAGTGACWIYICSAVCQAERPTHTHTLIQPFVRNRGIMLACA